MTIKINNIESLNFSEPVVVFPLKDYEALMEYVEDIEDKLIANERMDDPEISQEEMQSLFDETFGDK